MAITDDGTLWGWGSDTYGELGNGSQLYTSVVPTKIGSNITEVSSGVDHTLAIKADGTLWAWGSNYYGQLGASQNLSQSQNPVQVGVGYSKVFASNTYSHAIKTDGSLWGWGSMYSNISGNFLSKFTTDYRLTPFKIGDNFTKVVAGGSQQYVLALKNDGSLWGWGQDYYGQFGRGYNIFTTVVQPTQINSNVLDIATSSHHTLIVKRDNTLWSYGYNFSGQLGNDPYQYESRVPIKIGDGFLSVATGRSSSFAIKTDGSLWTWGDNQFGTLGNGATGQNALIPTKIGNGYSALSSGSSTLGALKTDGTLWTWGYGSMFGYVAASIDTLDVSIPSPKQVVFPLATASAFTATGTSQGNSSALTLTASISIDSTHTSNTTTGAMFIIAIFPNGVAATYTSNGWQLFNSMNPVGWSNSLQNKTTTILNAENLSSFVGTKLYAGYGIGNFVGTALNEMITSSRFKLIHTIQ